MRRTVAIVGGGISGLAAAHRLLEIAPHTDVEIFESSDRLGGVIETIRREGFTIDAAADSFMTAPNTAVEFCKKIGLESDLIRTREGHRRAFVVSKGKLRNIPSGFVSMAPSKFLPILTTPILSPLGKLRLALEYMVPPSHGVQDESLAQFAKRRFGSEAYRKLIQPLVAGIYSADPNLLSMAATMPRFLQMEKSSGSITRALMSSRSQTSSESGARYGQFAALKNGMSSLIEAVANRLPQNSVRLGAEVKRIVPLTGGRWRISVSGQNTVQKDVDALIFAIPAHQTSRILSVIAPQVIEDLRNIDSSSCAVIALAYRREQIQHRLNGFGVVVPLAEKRRILSCSFSSVKFEGRAPSGLELFRVFIGGECQPELLELTDGELFELAHQELTQLLKVRGSPRFTHIVRHVRVIPQYHVGHLDRIARIEKQLDELSTLKLAGSMLRGGGVPGCIASGEHAAECICSALSEPSKRLLNCPVIARA